MIGTLSCQSQSIEKINYSTPFSKSDIAHHEKNIRDGRGYLLLVPYSNFEMNKYRIVNTQWYTPVNDNKFNPGFIDSLFMFGLNKGKQATSPILQSSLKFYEKDETCDLIDILFTKEGFFRGWHFTQDARMILSILLQRGVLIHEIDYNGELMINPNEFECN